VRVSLPSGFFEYKKPEVKNLMPLKDNTKYCFKDKLFPREIHTVLYRLAPSVPFR
jgi:hypothetical protein